jgi:molecular chaperone GrpE
MFGPRKNKDQNPEEPGQPPQPGNAPDTARETPDADFEAAGMIEDLQKQVESLTVDRDHYQDKYIRTLADYQNSQRRALTNEREAKSQGIKSVTLNILTVLDHFDLALGVDATKATAEQVITGVKVIRDELMRVLTTHGVVVINPAPNDEFDPKQHQAVLQEPSDAVEPGRVVKTLQPGYALEDRLIRPAMVSVRPT